MKKIIISFFCLSLGLITKAQTEKGDWMVGGNFGLNTSDNNTLISFTPSAGYFIVNNLALGGNFLLNSAKSGNNKTTTFGVGPFARYYFTSQTQIVRPILQGSFNYTSTKTKIGNSASSTNTGSNYFIGGGAAAFISRNVSIDAIMGYDHTKLKGDNGSGGFAFNIGFQVYLLRSQVEKITGK